MQHRSAWCSIQSRTNSWWCGSGQRWNSSASLQEEDVADDPQTGQSKPLDDRRAQQPSAAPVPKQQHRQCSTRGAQGLAATKKGPEREIQQLQTIMWQPSTTLNARIRMRIQTGRIDVVRAGPSAGVPRPKGVGWQGGAGGAAAPEQRASLVRCGANVDARSCLLVARPSLSRTSPCGSTTTSSTRKGTGEAQERGERERPAQTTRRPSRDPEHGCHTKERTESTRFSVDRPSRRFRARCPVLDPGWPQAPTARRRAAVRSCRGTRVYGPTDRSCDRRDTHSCSLPSHALELLSREEQACPPGGDEAAALATEGTAGRLYVTGVRGRRVDSRAYAWWRRRVPCSCMHTHLREHRHRSARALVSGSGAAGRAGPPRTRSALALQRGRTSSLSLGAGAHVVSDDAFPGLRLMLHPMGPSYRERTRLPAALGGVERRGQTSHTPPRTGSLQREEIRTPDQFQPQEHINRRYFTHSVARTPPYLCAAPGVGMGVRLRGGVGKTGFPMSVSLRQPLRHASLARLVGEASLRQPRLARLDSRR